MLIRLTRAGLSSSLSSYAVCPLSPAPVSFPKTLRYESGIIYWVISSTNQLSNYRPLQLGVWCISSPQDLGHDALWHFVSHKQAAALWLNVGGVNLWMKSVFRQMNLSVLSQQPCFEYFLFCCSCFFLFLFIERIRWINTELSIQTWK